MIPALYISIWRIIRLFDKLALSNNCVSKPTFSRNNNSKLVSEKKNSNNKAEFDDNDMKYAKKS